MTILITRLFFYIINIHFMHQSSTWKDFAEHFHLDPQFGTLMDPHFSNSFNQPLLKKMVGQFHLMSEDQILKEIDNFSSLQASNMNDFKEALGIHDYVVAILARFLLIKRKQNTPNQQIKFPRNLALPLFKSSNGLGIKFGMTSSLSHLWEPVNNHYLQEDQSFGFGDFKIKFWFTERYDQELYFFGGSIIAAFYLARINRLAFEINETIQEDPKKQAQIGHKLSQCLTCWRKIIKQNKFILEKLESQFFYYQLRPFLGSFQNIIFQGADNGSDIRVSSPGGSGGNDSSFQIFQRNFGITIEGGQVKIQQMLQGGMISQHRLLIKYLQETSRIRNFCADKPHLAIQYNLVLQAYVQFLQLHAQFIRNFIFRNNGGNTSAKGTGETVIEEMIGRYKLIEAQMIK